MNMWTCFLLLPVVVLASDVAAQSQPIGTRSMVTTAADKEPVPLSPFQPDLTPGYVLIEQDIQIPLDEYRQLLSPGPKAVFGTVSFWANQEIPFDFVTTGMGAVFAANQTRAIDAMNAIAAIAAITFRPAVVSDADRIRFQNSTVNSSPVGRRGGTQMINIVSWLNRIIIIHEIYHSLGFWHQQSHPNRDLWVTINYDNICGSAISDACTAGNQPGQCCSCVDANGNCTPCFFNFDIRAGAQTYGTYDFDSFMHYGRTAFTCNGLDTITVNPPWNTQWQGAIGQLDHFSYLDSITCRGVYPFAGDTWLEQYYAGTQSGTFAEPWNIPFLLAVNLATPSGGTLFVSPGNYPAIGTYNPAKPGITIQAPLGGVTLGN